MIRIKTLGSGSSGNCVHIIMNDKKFLVDLGVRYRRILSELGDEDFSAVFITHAHYDHVSGFPVCVKHFEVPFYASKRTRDKLANKKVKGLEYEEPFMIDGLRFTLIPTDHDCAGSCGYTFEYAGSKVSLITDLGHMSENIREHLLGSDVVIIESNHDVEMLKNGSYPYMLKQRILSDHGHLSNADCAATCRYLAENGTRHFLLAHLSLENNEPELALRETMEALAGLDCSVEVLPRFGGEAYVFD